MESETDASVQLTTANVRFRISAKDGSMEGETMQMYNWLLLQPLMICLVE